MALTKRNGEYWTPNGCSAWNGRCFAAARHDAQCNVAFIQFTRSGWYRAEEIAFAVMVAMFEGNEDAGCDWNCSQNAAFKQKWSPVTDAAAASAKFDAEWNPADPFWTFTGNRNPSDPPPDCKPA